MKKDDKNYVKKRRLVSILSLLAFAGVIIALTLLFTRVFAPYLRSAEEFRAYLRAFGWKGRIILFLLQCVQVIIALIPGEVIELGAGYAYGALEGGLICLAGVAVSSSVIFLLTKKAGVSLVEAFIPREKIDSLRFINSEKKLKRTIFLLFLIPGTPKDLLTYFAGLTKIRLSEFLIITLIARIPSVVSSTVSGHLLGKENYLTAAIVYAVTIVISALGYYIYNRIVAKKKPVS